MLYLRERTRLGDTRSRSPRADRGRAARRRADGADDGAAGADRGGGAGDRGGRAVAVSRKIPTETDPEKFVPSDSSVLADLHHVRDVVGSTSELNLLIELGRAAR